MATEEIYEERSISLPDLEMNSISLTLQVPCQTSVTNTELSVQPAKIAGDLQCNY